MEEFVRKQKELLALERLCQRNSAEFPAHNITSGDIVGVIQQV